MMILILIYKNIISFAVDSKGEDLVPVSQPLPTLQLYSGFGRLLALNFLLFLLSFLFFLGLLDFARLNIVLFRELIFLNFFVRFYTPF